MEGIKWLLNRGRYLQSCFLADAPGIGKTVQVLSALVVLCKKLAFSNILVITPTSSLVTWIYELKRFPELDASTLVLVGETKDCKKTLRHHLEQPVGSVDRPKLILTSFDTFDLCSNLLLTIRWDAMIVDEAHLLSNPTTGLHKLAAQVSAMWRVFISATPHQNSFGEFLSLLNLLDPAVFSHDVIQQLEPSSFTDIGRGNYEALVKPFFLSRTKKELPTPLHYS